MSSPWEAQDYAASKYWAIGRVSGAGASAGVAVFELVNLTTRQAHRLLLASPGLSAGSPGGAGRVDSYSTFVTESPFNFTDFDEAGGSLTPDSTEREEYLSLWTDHGSAIAPNICEDVEVSGPTFEMVTIQDGECTLVPGSSMPTGHVPSLVQSSSSTLAAGARS